jgi:hypothetical protein
MANFRIVHRFCYLFHAIALEEYAKKLSKKETNANLHRVRAFFLKMSLYDKKFIAHSPNFLRTYHG